MNRRNFIKAITGIAAGGFLFAPKEKEYVIYKTSGMGFSEENLGTLDYPFDNLPIVKIRDWNQEYKWEGIAYSDSKEVKMLHDALSAYGSTEKGLIPEQVEKSIYDPELSAKVGYPTGSVIWTKKHLKMFENL